MDANDEAPGWHAIDAALAKLYGGLKPRHFAPPIPPPMGNDPLNGISIYPSSFGGRPHWHFITYGFSELFSKESEPGSPSGYGFELTMRVVDPEAVEKPPLWPLYLLQNLARYVFRSGNVFAPGHHSSANGPLALVRDTSLVAAGFVRDPQLSPIDTPNGALQFVQLVGLTQDEYDAVKAWDTLKFLGLLAEIEPAMLTDLLRPSLLTNPDFQRKVAAGTAADGSSMEMVFCVKGGLEVAGGKVILGVGANAMEELKMLMRGRLNFGRTASLAFPDTFTQLKAGPATRVTDSKGGSLLELSPVDRDAILALPARRGDYPLPSGAGLIRVIPVEIFDWERKKVVRVVG